MRHKKHEAFRHGFFSFSTNTGKSRKAGGWITLACLHRAGLYT